MTPVALASIEGEDSGLALLIQPRATAACTSLPDSGSRTHLGQ
jgi:hypothetical protein